MSRPRVVLVEDDPDIRKVLLALLSMEGYTVYLAETGARGLSEIAARRPDIVLLDLGLPDLDGLSVLRKVRSWSTTPVVVISALGEETLKVQALDTGADDYLVKPFGRKELLARIRVAMRHAAKEIQPDGAFEHAGIAIDISRRRVTVHGVEVRLTVTEFKLLTELVRAAGRVVTHRQLLVSVWGPSHAKDTHYLRLYMSQLRSKLEEDPACPEKLLTEQGVGYRLATPD